MSPFAAVSTFCSSTYALGKDNFPFVAEGGGGRNTFCSNKISLAVAYLRPFKHGFARASKHYAGTTEFVLQKQKHETVLQRHNQLCGD